VDCAECALIFLSPAPAKADLDQLYIQSEQFTHPDYTDEARNEATLAYMRVILDHAVRISQTKHPRVLEIGSGFAWMCRAAKQADASAFTVAQDITQEVAEKCPWVDRYVVGEVSDPRLDEFAPFDVASMTHVIEHLIDPEKVLRRVAGLMRPGGVLFVSAPYRPEGWKRGGAPEAWETYRYHHVPAHTQYFSEEAMRRLARTTGFQVSNWNANHERGEAFDALLVRI
jgi:2-polyprenyl-3-methyl-5-hydroxy-6-metoxy-1,4-benzoquinol methylase